MQQNFNLGISENPQGYSEKVQVLKKSKGCILECMEVTVMVTCGSRIDLAFPAKA